MTDARLVTPYPIRAHWGGHAAGDEPTAATVQIWRDRTDGDKDYLQSDLQSVSTTPHDFAMTSLGGGSFEYTGLSGGVPAVFKGTRINWEAVATGPLTYPPQGTGHYVTGVDEDGLVPTAGKGGSRFGAQS